MRSNGVAQAAPFSAGADDANGAARSFPRLFPSTGALDHKPRTSFLVKAVAESVAASLGRPEPFACPGVGAVADSIFPVDVFLGYSASRMVFSVADENVGGAHIPEQAAVSGSGAVVRSLQDKIAVIELVHNLQKRLRCSVAGHQDVLFSRAAFPQIVKYHRCPVDRGYC